MQKPHELEEYNGKGDPDKHVQLVNDRFNYYCIYDAFKFNLLVLTLVGPTMLWFNGLPNCCIELWKDTCDRLTAYFNQRRRK